MSHKNRSQTLEEGFEKFVIKKDGCWDWSGCCPEYGQFRSKGKMFRSHRASWMIHCGDIPKGMYVLHKCDNKRCSNPEHLFLGTHLDNIHDMIKKNRHPTMAKSGEKNHRSRLTEEQVKKIKKLFGSISIGKIAQLFNAPKSTIGNIKYKLTWRS